MVLSSTPRIDLHGFDRDYASICVKDFIADNYLMGSKIILIIHGKGEGVIRKRIHDDLRKNCLVERYQLNMFNDGETVVYLKEKRFDKKR